MKVKHKSSSLARAMIESQAPEGAVRRSRASGRRAPRVRRTATDLIDEQVRSERMDPEETLVRKVHALFEPSKLPRAMRAAGVSKCNTPQLRRVVHELRERYARLSPKARAEISKYIRLRRQGGAYVVEYPERVG